MLWWTLPALACPPGDPPIEGFEPGLDGAIVVPIDARLVLRGGESGLKGDLLSDRDRVPVSSVRFASPPGGPPRVALVPMAPLLPMTAYHIDVFYDLLPPEDPPVLRASASFRTGPAPSRLVDPPSIAQVEATAWDDEGWVWNCSLGSRGFMRELRVTVGVDEAQPFSYLMLRSQPAGTVEHVVPLVAGEQVLVYRQPDRSADWADHDCIEAVVVLPNGQEVAGEPWCLPPEPTLPVDTAATAGDSGTPTEPSTPAPLPSRIRGGQGCGCHLPGGAPPSGALAGLALLGALRRRRG